MSGICSGEKGTMTTAQMRRDDNEKDASNKTSMSPNNEETDKPTNNDSHQ